MATVLKRSPPPSLDELEAFLRSRLEEEPHVLFAYLFGSFAKGTARAASDVDLAVCFDEGKLTERERTDRAFALAGELARELHREVQVVVLNESPPAITHNVLQHGRLLVLADREAWRRYRIDHARRWFDAEPARQLFRQARWQRIVEGTFGGGIGNRR